MSKFEHSLILLIAVPILLNAQFLRPKLCTTSGPSGIYIQQVDLDWNPIVFDCANIEVIIIGEAFEKHIKPGDYPNCSMPIDSRFLDKNKAFAVIGESPGTYEVIISRFNEVSNIQNVLFEWGDSGCDVYSQTLEVQFDMSKQSNKRVTLK